MATASEELFVKLRYWLVSGGMMTRIACGRTVRRMVIHHDMPRATDASVCPSGTEMIPARMISAM